MPEATKNFDNQEVSANTSVKHSIKTDEAIVYPPFRKVLPILLALCASMFLVALDRNIVSTAIPQITNEFHSINDVGWYGSAYMLTSSAFMLLFGKIYTFYSTKWALLTAIGLFEVGSAICGAAPNSTTLIVGRAIAGWGSSGIFTGVLVTSQHILPLQKRPIVMAMMGATFGISSVAGPLLGGAFTTNVSWRWCFYINLPIGGAAMLLLFLMLETTCLTEKTPSLKQQLIRLDPIGTLCFLPGITCLLLALQWGGLKYSWGNSRIIVLLILAAFLIITFICIQIWKQETATVPPKILKQRSIAAGFIFSFCNGAAMTTMIYYLPIWFQAIKGVNAIHSGIDTISLLLASTVGTISGGIAASKLRYYVPQMIIGPIFMTIGAGLMVSFYPGTREGNWIGYQILFGYGNGVCMQQASMAAQTVLDRKDVPIGSALMMFAQQISGAIFVSIGENVMNNCLEANLQHMAGLDASLVTKLGTTELRNIVPSNLLNSVLVSYNKALRSTFIIAVVMSGLCLFPAMAMEWKSIRSEDKDADESTVEKRQEGVEMNSA